MRIGIALQGALGYEDASTGHSPHVVAKGFSMSFWVIISWIFVAILTGVNVFVFLKLKEASEQMMKMAFPGAKNMNEAMSRMQGMMGQMSGSRGPGRPGVGGQNMDAQLKAAMDMLQNMKKGNKR